MGGGEVGLAWDWGLGPGGDRSSHPSQRCCSPNRATAVGAERRGSEAALGCEDEGDSRAAGDPRAWPFAKKFLQLWCSGRASWRLRPLSWIWRGNGIRGAEEHTAHGVPRSRMSQGSPGRGGRRAVGTTAPASAPSPVGWEREEGPSASLPLVVPSPAQEPPMRAPTAGALGEAERPGTPSSPALGHQRHPPWPEKDSEACLLFNYGGGLYHSCGGAPGKGQRRALRRILQPQEPPGHLHRCPLAMPGSGSGVGPAGADAQSQQCPGLREAAATQDPRKMMPPRAEPALLLALGHSWGPLPWWLCPPGP